MEGVEPINAWAARVTKGLITTAVPPGTPFDVVLTNAVYFKGLWELPFDKAATQDLPFRLSGSAAGSSVGVPMMFKTFKPSDATSSRERYVRYAAALDYSAVRLPYRGGTISALAVLPSEGALSHAGGDVTKALAALDVGRLLDERHFRKPPPAGLDLLLPKFTIKSECVSLKTVNACVYVCLCVCMCVWGGLFVELLCTRAFRESKGGSLERSVYACVVMCCRGAVTLPPVHTACTTDRPLLTHCVPPSSPPGAPLMRHRKHAPFFSPPPCLLPRIHTPTHLPIHTHTHSTCSRWACARRSTRPLPSLTA